MHVAPHNPRLTRKTATTYGKEMKPLILVVCILFAQGGCHSLQADHEPIDPADRRASGPLEITFLKKAHWTEGHVGFDPELPGYHITGDIASIQLQPGSGQLPDSITLAIKTSPGMRPNLEGFTFSAPDTVIATAFFEGFGLAEIKDPTSEEPWRTVAMVESVMYFRFTVVGKAIHVTFMPAAMKLLHQQCTISWVDWYRG